MEWFQARIHRFPSVWFNIDISRLSMEAPWTKENWSQGVHCKARDLKGERKSRKSTNFSPFCLVALLHEVKNWQVNWEPKKLTMNLSEKCYSFSMIPFCDKFDFDLKSTLEQGRHTGTVCSCIYPVLTSLSRGSSVSLEGRAMAYA